MFSTSLIFAKVEEVSNITHLTKENITRFIDESSKPVIIDFYADWCSPCKQMAPIFEQLSQDLSDKYIFAKANFDTASELAATYEIKMLPTLVVIKDKKELAKLPGLKTLEQLKEELDEIISGKSADLSKLDKAALKKRLIEAIKSCDVKTALNIINAGTNVNEVIEDVNLTPLNFAIVFCPNFGQKGIEMIKCLIDNGASLDLALPTVGVPQGITSRQLLSQMIENFGRIAESYKNLEQLINVWAPLNKMPNSPDHK